MGKRISYKQVQNWRGKLNALKDGNGMVSRDDIIKVTKNKDFDIDDCVLKLIELGEIVSIPERPGKYLLV